MKRISLLTILLIYCSLTVRAQVTDSATPNGGWTLKQCIDHALSNNLTVQRSLYAVENSDINYKQAKLSMIPSLNTSLSYGYNWGRSVNPVTNAFTTREINYLSPGAGSSVTLFNAFRIQNTIKQNSRDYNASVEELQKTKNDLTLSIASLFINVIFAREQLDNANYQLSSSQQQLERTKKQVAAGALPVSDELNMEATVATNELTVIQNENALNMAMLQLKQALQIPMSTPFDVDVPELNVEDLILDQDRDEIYEIARTTLPEVKAARLRVESAEYGMKAARGGLYPRITLNGSLNSNYSSASDGRHFVSDGGTPDIVYPQIGVVGGPGGTPVFSADPVSVPSGTFEDSYGPWDQLGDNIFRQVSVTLAIPIFNGNIQRATYQRAAIDRQLASVSAREIDNTLRQNVETAYNEALAAAKTYTSTQKQLAAREEAFRMTKQRFDIGAVPYVEYQVSENDYFRSRSDLVRAKYDFILKKKVLDFYQGKPIDY
jgi:outer membrane protein